MKNTFRNWFRKPREEGGMFYITSIVHDAVSHGPLLQKCEEMCCIAMTASRARLGCLLMCSFCARFVHSTEMRSFAYLAPQDYENALSTYKLVKEDYKSDKAHLHHAHACAMIGVCIYMIDPVGRQREMYQQTGESDHLACILNNTHITVNAHCYLKHNYVLIRTESALSRASSSTSREAL
jgi:hypothetical protein